MYIICIKKLCDSYLNPVHLITEASGKVTVLMYILEEYMKVFLPSMVFVSVNTGCYDICIFASVFFLCVASNLTKRVSKQFRIYCWILFGWK